MSNNKNFENIQFRFILFFLKATRKVKERKIKKKPSKTKTLKSRNKLNERK